MLNYELVLSSRSHLHLENWRTNARIEIRCNRNMQLIIGCEKEVKKKIYKRKMIKVESYFFLIN